MAYDASSIQILDGVDGIRKRPTMYIHDTDVDGLHQLVTEIIDNAVDEHLAGHCSKIVVKLDTRKQSVSVEDNGRGIPGGKHESGVSTLTAVFTSLHSGGKFDKSSYKVSGGLHGVGGTVVNALSERLYVKSWRGLRTYSQRFARGVQQTKLARRKLKNSKTGTLVRFVPDSRVFSAKLDPARVESRLREVASVCPGLTIDLYVDGKPSRIRSKNGLSGILTAYLDERGGKRLHKIVTASTDVVDAALVWSNLDGEHWYNYVNVTAVPDGGTPVTGGRRAVTQAFKGITDATVNGDDLRDGLVAALHVRCEDPQFKGQTKTKLLNREVESLVYDALIGPLTDALSDSKVANRIVRRAVNLQKERERFKRVKESLKRGEHSRRRGVLPGKLAEAPGCAPNKRELFIVEGDSAGGIAKQARNAKYQEVLPLRGKITNAARSGDSALNNKEIQALVAAIGAGVNHKASSGCEILQARVGKVLLLMDADQDGQHITSLLLTFLSAYMQPIIRAGMVYIVQSPLFVGQHRGKRAFGDTIDDVRSALGTNSKAALISRLKGHGEANVADLRHYAMNPKTRKLVSVAMPDDPNGIDNLMGADSSHRKKLLGIT